MPNVPVEPQKFIEDCDHVITQWICILIAFSLSFLVSCGEPTFEMISAEDKYEIQYTLEGQNFLRYEPNEAARNKKAVRIDFSDGLYFAATQWENDIAVHDWSIRSRRYSVERSTHGSRIKIYFVESTSRVKLPHACQNCLDTSGVSISVRDVFDSEKIRFKINDPDNNLPPPFPLFHSWTQFPEY